MTILFPPLSSSSSASSSPYRLSFNLWPLKKQSPDGEAQLVISPSILPSFSTFFFFFFFAGTGTGGNKDMQMRGPRRASSWIGAREIVSHNSGEQIDVSCKLCHSSSGLLRRPCQKASVRRARRCAPGGKVGTSAAERLPEACDTICSFGVNDVIRHRTTLPANSLARVEVTQLFV